MILRRILQFWDEFEESLVYLKGSLETANRRKDFIFEEDLCNLTCNLTDMLLELGYPITVEEYLCTEIMQQDRNDSLSSFGRYLLELSLVDALFAQNCFEEAEWLCFDI